jgi:predicted DNA-binding protein (MmcQ/YjbR family)
MMSDALETARRVCLSLPEATEQAAWGEPTFRVRKKMFGMYASGGNHHGAGRDSLWCAAPIGIQELMVRSEPQKYFVPPYVGVKGWIGIYLDAVDEAELRSQVVQSYCLIAPRKLQALVAE